MELLAVHVGALEDRLAAADSSGTDHDDNLLDYVSVYRHADAKLRGFGACTKVRNAGRDRDRDRYLLLCGKGIKNIHVWSFEPPPERAGPADAGPTFRLIYNCVTNGNSINLLSFRHAGPDRLLALSKSQQQKLRVWDLSHEEARTGASGGDEGRPARPPFADVANTEAMLGVAGGFCLCGGSDYHFNQMSIVSLEDVHSSYNHTELALPGVTAPAAVGRRQQRGDLKHVDAVAGMTEDGGHALLELNDRTLVQYVRQGSDGGCLPALSVVPDSELPDGWSRALAVGRVGSNGPPVAVIAVHNPFTGRGTIRLLTMDELMSLKQPLQDSLLSTAPQTASRIPPVESDHIEAIAASIHPFTTAKKAEPSTAEKNEKRMHAKSIPRMRDLTNEASLHRKPALERSDEARLGHRSADSKTEPSIRTCSSDFKATHKLLDSVTLSSKVKHSKSKRLKSDQGSDSVTEKRGNKEARRGSADNESLSSVTEKTNKKLKSSVASVSTPIPSVPRKPAYQLKQQALPVPDRTVRDPSASSVPLAPSHKYKNVESTVKSPILSPKHSRQQRNDEDFQNVVREKCIEQQSKLQLKLSAFPAASVSARMGLNNAEIRTLDERLERQRLVLSAEHQAAHERLAKTVLRAAHDILQSVQRSPSLQSLESAREFLRVTVQNFRARLDQQLQYQQLQAEALAAQQTWERQGQDAPCVPVAFPFAQVFEQALESLPQLIR